MSRGHSRRFTHGACVPATPFVRVGTPRQRCGARKQDTDAHCGAAALPSPCARMSSSDPTSRTLAHWLDYQQRVHALGVDLGLARVGEVWRRMGGPACARTVVTVGGTNGKGSTVAFLEAMLVAAGKRVGCYTSPHLLRYNERVRVEGRDADDATLIDAFERIEHARNADAGAIVPLTYFEFGTLAALWIFAQSDLDVALLEVGLGGRLDAVNIIDADAAIVTTIDLDHMDWLGDSRDAIAREKAGIFRRSRPAIIGDENAPAALLEFAEQAGAHAIVAGRDYRIADAAAASSVARWTLDFGEGRDGEERLELPEPALAAPVQRANAAAAIAALRALRGRVAVSAHAFAEGIRSAHVAARLQCFTARGKAELIIDVAHNAQAAAVLARWLEAHPPRGRTLFVFGALADKDIAGIVAPLAHHAAQWFVGGLEAETPRGLAAAELVMRMTTTVPSQEISAHADISAALAAAAAAARESDRIVAFGSFFVAAAVLGWADAYWQA